MYGLATETTEHLDWTAISVLSVAAINPIEIRFIEIQVVFFTAMRLCRLMCGRPVAFRELHSNKSGYARRAQPGNF